MHGLFSLSSQTPKCVFLFSPDVFSEFTVFLILFFQLGNSSGKFRFADDLVFFLRLVINVSCHKKSMSV